MSVRCPVTLWGGGGGSHSPPASSSALLPALSRGHLQYYKCTTVHSLCPGGRDAGVSMGLQDRSPRTIVCLKQSFLTRVEVRQAETDGELLASPLPKAVELPGAASLHSGSSHEHSRACRSTFSSPQLLPGAARGTSGMPKNKHTREPASPRSSTFRRCACHLEMDPRGEGEEPSPSAAE